MARKPFPPDQDQRDVILRELDAILLVEAAAGTGKTTMLVGRMVALLAAGKCEPQNLAAVTFTRKAAAELQARFQATVERAAREATGETAARLRDAATRTEQVTIGTIHSFCARLLRERPVEAAVDLEFRPVEPEEDALLRARAWESFAARLYAEDAPLLKRLEDVGLELADLEEGFKRFAEYPDVEEWPAEEIQLDDLSQTTRAALEEYQRHLASLSPTFPEDRGNDELMDACDRLRRTCRRTDLSTPRGLYAVLEVFNRTPHTVQKEWPGGKGQGKAEKERWEAFAAETVAPFLAAFRARRYAVILDLYRAARDEYEVVKGEAAALNYQDLLMKAAALLRDHPTVRRYFRRRFTHLLVDEFQDTDPLQAQVMLYLTATDENERDWRRCVPAPGALFVVGDPKQSIYRFRRADIVTYGDVARIVEGAGGRVVRLSASFRAVRPLLDWVNGFFGNEVNGFPKRATPAAPAYVALEPGRPAEGDAGDAGLYVIPVPYGNQDPAAAYDSEFIAKYIRQALDAQAPLARASEDTARGKPPHVTPGDFLIVTWAKKRLAVYARALQALAIPHAVTGGTALNEVEELALLTRLVNAVLHPEDPVRLVAALRSELFGVSDAALYAFRAEGGEFNYRRDLPADLPQEVAPVAAAYERLRAYAALFEKLPPVAAIERVADLSGLAALAAAAPRDGDFRAGGLYKALELTRVNQAAAWTAADAAAYLDELVKAAEDNLKHDAVPARADDGDVVRVMNLHQVKGLEAPVVFLADPSGYRERPAELHVDRSGDTIRGWFAVDKRDGTEPRVRVTPLARPSSWEDYQEKEAVFVDAERSRLRYVAATRAAARLIVSLKTDKPASNPWHFFEPALAAAPRLAELPAPELRAPAEAPPLRDDEAPAAAASFAERNARATAPTYRSEKVTERVRRLGLAPAEFPPGALAGDAGPGEHGVEWGNAVHAVLEAAARTPGADLSKLAAAALREGELDAALAADLVATSEAALEAEPWRRAASARRGLAEVPLYVASDEDDAPALTRGVVDLAFEEDDGWVLVDYKTTVFRREDYESLKAYYAPQIREYARLWEVATGASVKEIGFLFVNTANRETDYVEVER